MEKEGLKVSVAVEDKGGSTDVSPTQAVYLTVYAKGEMFSSDATFKIDDVYSFESAQRVSGGVYQVVATGFDDNYAMVKKIYTIDAKKAVTDIQAVNCSDFDCAASENFSSVVDVQVKSKALR